MSLSTTEKLKVEIVDHVAKLTIDNPAANTWDTESLPALADLVEKLNADRNIYALVITGQGRRGGTGVIRGSVHEWLTGPALRGVVSGFAAAARHPGGDGALYVTSKRPG